MNVTSKGSAAISRENIIYTYMRKHENHNYTDQLNWFFFMTIVVVKDNKKNEMKTERKMETKIIIEDVK